MKSNIRFSLLHNKKVLSFLVFPLLLVLLTVNIISQKPAGGFWTGWYPLMIPEAAAGNAPLSELLDITGGQLVYKENTRFFYNRYNGSGPAYLAMPGGEEGFISSDPRLDPFILGAGKYFQQDIYNILYLPADRSPLQYRSALRQLWDPSWILPDIQWDFPVLILAGLLSFFLLFRSGGGFLPCLLMITYTGALLFRGNQNILLPGVISVYMMSQYRKEGLYRLPVTLLVPLSGLAAYITEMISLPDFAVFLLIFFAGLLIPLSSLPGKKSSSRRSRRDHELFVPVSLGSVVISEGRNLKRIAYILIQSVFLIVFLFAAATRNRSLPAGIPGYGDEEGLSWSWNGISQLKPSAEFPGVREMLMHRAYQEALPYGGTWRLPAEGETLSVPVYTMSEGRIQSSLKAVLHYDREWLESFLKEMPLEGPGILMKSERGPRSVKMRNERPGMPSTAADAAVVLIGILGILLNLLNAAAPCGSPSEDYRMRNHLLILRRKQQAA